MNQTFLCKPDCMGLFTIFRIERECLIIDILTREKKMVNS